jgi:hypothetical protein
MWRRNIAAALQSTKEVSQTQRLLDQPIAKKINGNP